MTETQSHRYSALTLLLLLCLSTTVSLAQTTTQSPTASSVISGPSPRTESSAKVVQTPIDLFAALPASEAVIVLDVKRLIGEAVPRLLKGEQEMHSLVLALADLKGVTGLDPRAVQQVVVGIRYSNPPVEKNPSNFEVVAIAQSNDAGQLATLIRNLGPGKVREQQYAGKVLYIEQLDQTELKIASTEAPGPEETEWAIAALDANTLVFGDLPYVRSSIDVNGGKGTKISAELVAVVQRNPRTLLSAVGLLPPSLMSAGQQLMNSEMSQALSSLKRFYASVELTPSGFALAVTLNTAGNEQAKTLAEVLMAVRTLAGTFAPGKTRRDKVVRDLISGLVVSAEGSEVQIKDQITQATVDELAKQVASGLYFSRGLAHVQQGDSDAAIADYDKSIMLDPESANTFINRGKARATKGILDAAIADYDKAISLDPDSVLAYNNRCFARNGKGDFDAAIADCSKAIALDPTFAFPYNNRGSALASQGNFEKAMADYDKSIALDAENIFAYTNRGHARNQLEDWDGAIADFEKVIAINDKSAEAYNGRGLARYYKGELDRAFADYDKSLALDPNGATAYNNRALALIQRGELDKAMADYDKSIALDETNEVVYSNRAILRRHKDDLNGAIADFDKAIAINPKLVDAYNGRGMTRYLKEESDLAIADFDKALSFDPKSVDAFNGRGLALYQKDHLDQAIAEYDKAIAINPDFAEAYGNRALSRLALRKDAEAEQDFKKCFELDQSLRPVFEPLIKEVKKTRGKKRN